jgi:hypothetical protein
MREKGGANIMKTLRALLVTALLAISVIGVVGASHHGVAIVSGTRGGSGSTDIVSGTR